VGSLKVSLCQHKLVLAFSHFVLVIEGLGGVRYVNEDEEPGVFDNLSISEIGDGRLYDQAVKRRT
jgi:hypothetical protein